MRFLSHVAGRLVAALDALCVGLLLVMFIVTAFQVFARYILNSPTSWSEELARFLMSWVTMIGAAALVRENDHISVDFLVGRMPLKVQRILAYVSDTLTICMSGLLVYYGWSLALLGGRAVSPGLGIKMLYPYLSIPCGALLLALVLLLSRLEAKAQAEGGLHGR